MKLILETSALLHPLTGIGRYTHELAAGLSAKNGLEIKFWVQNRLFDDLETVKRLKPRTHFPLWSKPFRVLKNRLAPKRYAPQIARSIFHGPNFFVPPEAERAVITVHDLSILRYPETHPAERLRQFKLNLERSVQQAKKILADSEFVRREIINEFSCPPDKIHTVYMGVSPQFRPPSETDARLMAACNLNADGYTLCVATLEPRKNIDKLLAAYQQLPESLRRRYPLILIGGHGWLADSLLEKIAAAERQGWARKLGYVSETDLVGLYQHARLFAYPSAYEGFGLPVLESMACGVPVITSDRSSLPEVGGNAALQINPDDVEQFAAALRQGLEDNHWRTAAREQGLRQAALFSWQKCVDETFALYQAV